MFANSSTDTKQIYVLKICLVSHVTCDLSPTPLATALPLLTPPECSESFFWGINTNMNIIHKIHIIPIQIRILFLTPWVTKTNKNIIGWKCSWIYSNIRIYSNFEKKNQISFLLLPTYQKIVDEISKLFCNFPYCWST